MTKTNIVKLKTGTTNANYVGPNDNEIMNIPLARAGEYELSDYECKQVRRRIYALNKENGRGWRWRTMRDFPFLLVWRIK